MGAYDEHGNRYTSTSNGFVPEPKAWEVPVDPTPPDALEKLREKWRKEDDAARPEPASPDTPDRL